MREGWLQTTLGDVCDLTKGTTPTMKARPGPYPLVVTAEDRASSDEFQFDTEAVCIPTVSSTGHGHASLKRVHYESGKFAVANILVACTAKAGAPVLMRYLWLLLDHSRDQLIVPLMKGTANVALSQRALAAVSLILPPLREQRRIVDLIGALDDTVAAAELRLQAAVDQLRSLRALTFVAGVLTTGRDAFDILIGVQRNPTRAGGARQTRYLRSANVTFGRLNLSDVYEMSFSPQEQAKYSLVPGDVLVSEGSASEAAVGAPCRWIGEMEGPVCFQNTLLRYRARPHVSSPSFVDHWCAWAYESGHFREVAGGSNIKHIGARRAEQMQVRLLPFDDQKTAMAPLDAAGDIVRMAQEHVATLTHVRSAILAALLTGKHEIPESYDELMGVAS